MAKLSNIIEQFIKDMLRENEDMSIEIKRNELAEKFKCAPSQINYVLTTRFTTDKGYYIESRRGGGGYIKIVKNDLETDKNIENLISNVIGDSITVNQAVQIIESFVEEEIISIGESRIMKAAIASRAIQRLEDSNSIRADIMKNMLLVLINRS